jgi:hypothetical protein
MNAMNKIKKSLTTCIFGLMLFLSVPGTMALASDWKIIDDSSWCSDRSSFFSESVCEVREMTINEAWEKITVDASPNGGLKIEGWDRDSILIKAKVQVRARSEEKAREIISEIDIETSGNKISADGPKFWGSDKSWSVSFSLMVPIKSNLKLTAMNGGISIQDINGRINAKTLNGGIALEKIAGDVDVNTLNGGITAELDGDRWEGRGLEAKTTNGGIKVEVPENYSADLEASTINGGIHIDFPVKVQGWIKKNIETTLGEGGAPLILKTINGGVSIDRK